MPRYKSLAGFIAYRIYRKVNISILSNGKNIELRSNISTKNYYPKKSFKFLLRVVIFLYIICIMDMNAKGDVCFVLYFEQFIRKTENPADNNRQDFRFGTLKGIRTPDPLLRRQMLYPTELAAHS